VLIEIFPSGGTAKVLRANITSHYITLETIYGGLSKWKFRDHYGDAATEQCLGMIAQINVFSVSNEMLRVMGQTGHRQVESWEAAAKE